MTSLYPFLIIKMQNALNTAAAAEPKLRYLDYGKQCKKINIHTNVKLSEIISFQM